MMDNLSLITEYIFTLSPLCVPEPKKYDSSLIDDIYRLAYSLFLKDKYTYQHSFRVAQMALETAKKMSFNQNDLNALYISAFFHDIGKLQIDNFILRKNSRLNDFEQKIIKKHPLIGDKLLEEFEGFDKIRLGVRHHHEKFNGQGYPDRLSQRDIPLFARIISVADSYDAMSTRKYNKIKDKRESLLEIRDSIGSHFDAETASSFIEII